MKEEYERDYDQENHPRRRETDKLVVTGRPVLYLLLAFAGGGLLGSKGVYTEQDCEHLIAKTVEIIQQKLGL